MESIISKRLQMEINALPKDIMVEVLGTNSKGFLHIKIIKNGITISIMVSGVHPFGPSFIILEDNLKNVEKSVNKRLNNWHPSIKISNILTIIDEEITQEKQRNQQIESIKSGKIITKEMIKDKYLPSSNFIGKYPEFQKQLHGLWMYESELGYVIFYVKNDNVNFVYQPKCSDNEPLLCQCYYALGCYPNTDKKFNLHIDDKEYIHNFILRLHNNSISLQFSSLNDDSILRKIIDYYDQRYFIGEYIELAKM